MVWGSWVCLLAPLAGFLAITLVGTRITRGQAGELSTLSVFVGFAGAVVANVDALGRQPDDRAVTSPKSGLVLAAQMCLNSLP